MFFLIKTFLTEILPMIMNWHNLLEHTLAAMIQFLFGEITRKYINWQINYRKLLVFQSTDSLRRPYKELDRVS